MKSAQKAAVDKMKTRKARTIECMSKTAWNLCPEVCPLHKLSFNPKQRALKAEASKNLMNA